MKKNILTIIILAMSLINIVLSAVIIFAVVPTSNKTSNLIDRVVAIVDLELEAPEEIEEQVSIKDIEVFELPNKLTITLKNNSNQNTHAQIPVSISVNKKHKDYKALQPFIVQHYNDIAEIVTEEFSKFKSDDVQANKNVIKEQVLLRIQEDIFQSDFIINVSFGNLILE